MGINFCCPKRLDDPCNHMFQDPLVELVEYVRGNGLEDIDVWKVLPEGLNNWLDTGVSASTQESCRIIVECAQYSKHGLKVAIRCLANWCITKTIVLFRPFRTLHGDFPCLLDLFRIVSNKAGNYRMISVNCASTSKDVNAGDSKTFQGDTIFLTAV